MLTSLPNFNFLTLIVSEIKRVSQNLMWGLLSPCPTPYAERLSVLLILGKIKQPAKSQHRISMHHAVMRIRISHRFSIICVQKWGFGSFEGKDVKILCSSPQNALPVPCVNTRLLVYRVTKSVQRPEL